MLLLASGYFCKPHARALIALKQRFCNIQISQNETPPEQNVDLLDCSNYFSLE